MLSNLSSYQSWYILLIYNFVYKIYMFYYNILSLCSKIDSKGGIILYNLIYVKHWHWITKLWLTKRKSDRKDVEVNYSWYRDSSKGSWALWSWWSAETLYISTTNVSFKTTILSKLKMLIKNKYMYFIYTWIEIKIHSKTVVLYIF